MKYILFGANGKMGQKIQALSKGKHELVKGFGSQDSLQDELADVVIDFSHASFFSDMIDYCLKNKLPVLSGTTNLSQKDFDKLQQASKTIPVLWASNTSLGVQVLRSLLPKLSIIKDWDIHIYESHHKHKVDSPSGTAKTLSEDLIKISGKSEIPIVSNRSGEIIGEHEIKLVSKNESISLSHSALNRDLFAEGAIKAAEFISQQKAGLYSMEDVIAL